MIWAEEAVAFNVHNHGGTGNTSQGDGGDGSYLTNAITGSAVTYAGGGGGGSRDIPKK